MAGIGGVKNLVVYRNENTYSAFPDITRLANGDLAVVFREGVGHVDPASRVVMVRSKDEGRTWDATGKTIVTANDLRVGKADERDPSITRLSTGEILVNFFKIQCLDPIRRNLDWSRSLGVKNDRFNIYWTHAPHPQDGTYLIKSFDDGLTWEERSSKVDTAVSTAAGTSAPILELENHDLLMPVYCALPGDKRSRTIVIRSGDRGRTWGEPATAGHDPDGRIGFEEPALAQAPDGRVICLMRTTDRAAEKRAREGGQKNAYLYQSVSVDNGHTWSTPRPTPVWGYPAHILPLKDGRLLCSYGYRRKPFGIRAVLSADAGRTWDIKREIIIRDDGLAADLGYTSSVQLSDGKILTVYYFIDRQTVRYIAGTIFSLGGN